MNNNKISQKGAFTLVQIAFSQILTMVILLVLGVICSKAGILDDTDAKKLSGFVLFVVNPIVIFMSYIREYNTALLGNLAVAAGLSGVSFTLALAAAHIIYKRRNGTDYKIEKLASVYSNCGFIGIPLISGVFGDEGVFYLTMYLTFFNLLIWTHGVFIMKGKPQESAAAHRRNLFTSVKPFFSPPILAVVLGFAFFMLRLSIPLFLLRPMQTLGNTNTPLAMLVAGVSIAYTNPFKLLENPKIYKLCAVRLLLIPGLFMLLVKTAEMFFNLPAAPVGTIIIATACPMGAKVVLFAHRYGQDAEYASELFAATTVLAMGTIPLLLFFL